MYDKFLKQEGGEWGRKERGRRRREEGQGRKEEGGGRRGRRESRI
jgi:hypothetical protein